MILVDTSVWIDHLREGEPILAGLLERGLVMGHPFVLGELACGTMKSRDEILRLLGALPTASVATPEECLVFIERHALMGRGIGYVDVHLLAAARLDDAKLWTRDRRLAKAAHDIDAAFARDRLDAE